MDQGISLAVAVGTICMAIGTLILAWTTRKATTQSQKYNKEILEVMRKSYEPALSLELWKTTPGPPYQVEGSDKIPYIYGVTIRNDGMGPAKNVKLTCWQGYMPLPTETEEIWKESDKDFTDGPTFNDIVNIAPRRKCEKRLGDLKNVSEGKGPVYAVTLQAICEDVFGNKNYEVKCKIHLDDAEER